MLTSPLSPPANIDIVTGCFGGIKIVTMRSFHDALHATVFQIIDMATHRARKNNSHIHMTCMHTQRGADHNPCYTPNKVGTVTGGTGSMGIAMVRSIHDVLYASVYQIIGMTTHMVRANTSHMACMHTQ